MFPPTFSFEKCPLWYETICQDNKVDHGKLVIVDIKISDSIMGDCVEDTMEYIYSTSEDCFATYSQNGQAKVAGKSISCIISCYPG